MLNYRYLAICIIPLAKFYELSKTVDRIHCQLVYQTWIAAMHKAIDRVSKKLTLKTSLKRQKNL